MEKQRSDAKETIESFVPMFRHLKEHNVDYCVVGGLGVLIRAYFSGSEDLSLRITHDADIMFDSEFDNAEFATAYLDSFAADPALACKVYDAMFGDGVFEELRGDEQRYISCSFIGPEGLAADGSALPCFDVVRGLNGFKLADLKSDLVNIGGVEVPVATSAQLLEMKKRTVGLLHADLATTSRPQDYQDIRTLETIIDREGEENEPIR